MFSLIKLFWSVSLLIFLTGCSGFSVVGFSRPDPSFGNDQEIGTIWDLKTGDRAILELVDNTARPKHTDSLKRKRARKVLEAQEKAEAKAAIEEAVEAEEKAEAEADEVAEDAPEEVEASDEEKEEKKED